MQMSERKYKRKIYLEDKPKDQALAELLQAFEFQREIEITPTTEALGRITAQPIYAKVSSPHYHASAMDGIAVLAESTYGAHEKNPLHLKLSKHEFAYVDTGNPLPSGFDAVIMIERVNMIDEDTIEIIEPASPWQHIRPVGEDVVSGEMIVPQGHKLRPVDLGALLAGGNLEIPVVKKPAVAIIPTGNEIVPPRVDVRPGQIIETNGTVFVGYVTEWGANPLLQPIVPDDPDLLKAAILENTKNADIVIINAGSSAGSKDYTAHIIAEMGELLSHGVATRPGKPVALGKVNGCIVVGLPGYPVSAYLSLEWFVKPLIETYLGVRPTERQTLDVKLGRRIVSTMGSEDYIRMNVGYVNDEYIANPLTRAAGVTMSMARADALLKVPANSLGFEQGEKVTVELYKPIDEIRKSILFSGSHDLTIDILSTLIRKQDIQRQIISAHTGSLAGILAIRKGEAHIAGAHLFDPETKTYNIPFLKKYLTGVDIVILPFLKREQGWIVPQGNPYEVASVRDIAAKKLQYVNRQKGAGTRLLFDHILQSENISPDEIIGYSREMFSHLSVAAEIKHKENSVGLGIYSAAKEMNLDFIPVTDESYDLIMTTSFFESEPGQLLYQALASPEFIDKVVALGGYKVNAKLSPIYL